jgi:sodium transport system permease protein
MSPGVELNLGTSLVPVTGIAVLLRYMLDGDYATAFQYAPIVAAVTLVVCIMSLRWAVDQFHSESVLFRESEQWDFRLMLRHFIRERRPTPSAPDALTCGVLILVIHFLLSFWVAEPSDFSAFVRTQLTTQLTVILVPTLFMTLLVTTSPRRTLLLKAPPPGALSAAVLLAIALAPLAGRLQIVVHELYPIGENMMPAIKKLMDMLHGAEFAPLVLVIALAPAVCEELAFRGFILSGFMSLGHKWRAIVYASLLFGLTHGILQQSLLATLTGVVLGYLAVQTGSIFPGVAFHLVHNTMVIAVSRITPKMVEDSMLLRFLAAPEQGGCLFHWNIVIMGMLAAGLLLAWFGRTGLRNKGL